MAIHDSEYARFHTTCRAAVEGRLALLECVRTSVEPIPVAILVKPEETDRLRAHDQPLGGPQPPPMNGAGGPHRAVVVPGKH